MIELIVKDTENATAFEAMVVLSKAFPDYTPELQHKIVLEIQERGSAPVGFGSVDEMLAAAKVLSAGGLSFEFRRLPDFETTGPWITD